MYRINDDDGWFSLIVLGALVVVAIVLMNWGNGNGTHGTITGVYPNVSILWDNGDKNTYIWGGNFTPYQGARVKCEIDDERGLDVAWCDEVRKQIRE